MSKCLDVCLNLILPNALKDEVIDQLLRHPEWVGPFTAHRAEGHGDPGSIASPAEQVRGCVERVRIEILMDARHVAALLEQLRTDLQGRECLWWQMPMSAAGGFL